MYMVREEDIKIWRDYYGLCFLQCACKFTEKNCARGTGDTNSKRLEIKELIRELKKKNPYVEGNIFASVENVNLDACIGYVKDGKRHHFLDEYD